MSECFESLNPRWSQRSARSIIEVLLDACTGYDPTYTDYLLEMPNWLYSMCYITQREIAREERRRRAGREMML